MDFERNYQIKYPSKQLNKQYYFTLISNLNLNLIPWFVTELTDSEG